jgi:integrase
MINGDVPQRLVQQFLGHETPAMTARYAHVHDSTMKRKLRTGVEFECCRSRNCLDGRG